MVTSAAPALLYMPRHGYRVRTTVCAVSWAESIWQKVRAGWISKEEAQYMESFIELFKVNFSTIRVRTRPTRTRQQYLAISDNLAVSTKDISTYGKKDHQQSK